MIFSNILFCPQPKEIQFTVIEEEKTFKRLESKKNDSKRFIDYHDSDSGPYGFKSFFILLIKTHRVSLTYLLVLHKRDF